MGVDINISAYSSFDNAEFQKHYKAVKFCIENDLSYPKETSEFFSGRVEGCDIEDIEKEYLLDSLKHGMEVEIPIKNINYEQHIKVSDIPNNVDTIVVSYR